MSAHNPRTLLLYALLLDWVGQILVLAFILIQHGRLLFFDGVQLSIEIHRSWFVFCFFFYPLLNWLFGSFTVLRWPRLRFSVLIQRLFISASVTFFVVIFASRIIHSEDVWLVQSQVQFAWLSLLAIWSLCVIIAHRRGFLFHISPQFMLLSID